MRKTNVKRSTIAVLACSAISISAVVVLQDVIPFFAMSVVFYALNAITLPISQSLVAEKAKGGDSNLVMGFYNSTKSLGGIFGSLFAGFMYSEGPKLAFVFAAAALGVSTLASIVYYRMDQKQATAQ